MSPLSTMAASWGLFPEIPLDSQASIGDIISHTRFPSGISTEDPACIEFLSQSFSYCLSNHASCSSRAGNTWIPKRLLDVSLLPPNSDSVVLVDRDDMEKPIGEQGVRYLTLSYVWGERKPLTLTQASVADMKKGLKLDKLPKCFRDAIKVTRSLGVQYLWIDALW